MTDFDELQGDSKVQCEAESEADLPSDCYFSDSDDETDAEVPDVTDPLACTSNLLQGAGNGKRFLNSSSVVWNNSVANRSKRIFREEIDIGRGWKPVNLRKPQELERFIPMLVSTVGPIFSPPSSKQTGIEMTVSPPLASAAADKLMKDGNESDSDVRRVPELSAKTSGAGTELLHAQGKGPSGSSHRKRGGASADKEHKRLKRLLRNRVSAQQARERKKAYLSELEIRSKELEHRNAELEERVSTLQRENQMLRQIVKNTALKKSGSGGSTEGDAQR